MEKNSLTPTEVRRMLDQAENNLGDYLILATMALTGLSRGEIVGARGETTWHITRFMKSKDKKDTIWKERIVKRLQAGETDFQYKGKTWRLIGNGKYVRGTGKSSITGLLRENFQDDCRILVQERLRQKPTMIKLHAFLCEKYKSFLGNIKTGPVFDIADSTVPRILSRYGKLAGIPYKLKSHMLTEFYQRYQWGLPGLLGITEYTSESIEAMIRGGENEEVEFKGRITDSKDFCETMVAFANRIGGIILLGVDDQGNPLGDSEMDLTEVEKKITNLNHEYCDPHVRVSVSRVRIKDKNATVVKVNEGLDKPYWLKDKGFVIRNGSSDRIMKRSEVKGFFASRV